MNSVKIFLTLAVVMALAIALAATPTTTGEDNKPPTNLSDDLPFPFSLRGSSRFLAGGGAMTCDRYPSICRTVGSLGPDCCKRQCVNLSTDQFNCGKCGKRCKYSEMCCGGECVNPFFSEKHCGQCNNRCVKGTSCVYGFCSYAG
ncbi:PREDICTED: stigma-specific STIG1-like protein 1 [Nelumbo nucifera]|uniref:Stigma-specific STIG1-like protein 1 n=2 Tax=Nelumbo nucifera TaxID=4432 RepID=A0A822XUL0_NELNU|nr:PREDICTED: stigma-specific STIG1-like protein 1 [Nelumbo nucifera]DAD23433.1 TPA_asm: hypothetical protein HUJ06_024896 [Nelumbo nucifera]